MRRCFRDGFSQKGANSTKFPAFFPTTREFWPSRDCEISIRGKPARRRPPGTGACPKNTHPARDRHVRPGLEPGTGMTGGGSDSVVIGRRLCEAKPKPSTVRPRNVAMASKLPVRPKAGARLSSPPPPQPRDEEAVEPGLPRGRRRQMAGQRAHVALRSDAFGHAADLAGLDRLAA